KRPPKDPWMLLNILLVAYESNLCHTQSLRIGECASDGIVFGKTVWPQMHFGLRNLRRNVGEITVELSTARYRTAIPDRRAVEVDFEIDHHRRRRIVRRGRGWRRQVKLYRMRL